MRLRSSCSAYLTLSVAIGLAPTSLRAAPAPAVSVAANDKNVAPAVSGHHVTNYDETRVGNYTLPNPLILENGRPVRDAKTWVKIRRPELLKLYERLIFGRVPKRAPKPRFELVSTTRGLLHGTADLQTVVAHFGEGPSAPAVDLLLYTPTGSTERVPVLLHLTFYHAPSLDPSQPIPTVLPTATPPRPHHLEQPNLEEVMRAGYAYATFQYTQLQPDGVHPDQPEVQKLAFSPGQKERLDDEWGTLAIWAWGASRMLDYLQTNPAVDASRVALVGHSRLGKVALLAGARDPRFAMVFASCSGEMGAALSRRDFGEVIDNMVDSFPWQFARNFSRYSGHWNDLPVDAHELIALNAPHPVFITGGSEDLWADPRGEFLAEVAAGPVYKLVGKHDLGTTEMPALDHPLLDGDLGFKIHKART